MAHNWYYARGSEKHGPISQAELKNLAAAGQLSADDLVWREDMQNWKKASSVPGLFQERSSPPVKTSAGPTPPPIPPELPGRPQPVTGATSTLESDASPSPLQFAWAEWNLGGKIIFVSACVAAVSMLMKWLDVGFASANGLSQGTFLFLGFFVYPVWQLLKRRPIHLYVGLGCAAGGMLGTIVYASKTTVSIGDRSVELFGPGAVIFFLACGALAFGVYKYQEPKT